MKIISYALFFHPSATRFEFYKYLLGVYFNARMNRLIYPDWITAVAVDTDTFADFKDYFEDLEKSLQVQVAPFTSGLPLCQGMLQRIRPIFTPDVTHVLCRDLDSVTTYREAQAVNAWLNSHLAFHCITDNPVHTEPLMGGMIGIKTAGWKKRFLDYDSFEMLIDGFNLNERGSDQQLLRHRIYNRIKSIDLFAHYFSGATASGEARVETTIPPTPLSGITTNLAESNLTIRHIGSPGVVEMELIRFFQRHDITDYSEFEIKHKNICYWQR